ncbi:hypothetical protein Pmani_026384 [Petrolisthes manimaculis]|uniref:Uncharacterized protein n=1 Tax=Petrolisthes manimaculis TaxID=1843537 RepID=A0AAE1P647_9EUCA|nr:hypothetical protein Pmani_026384 [Petrolisthes manimaculis]
MFHHHQLHAPPSTNYITAANLASTQLTPAQQHASKPAQTRHQPLALSSYAGHTSLARYAEQLPLQLPRPDTPPSPQELSQEHR